MNHRARRGLATILVAMFPYEHEFREVAKDRAVDRAAQVWQESRFNPRAENPYSHAKGLAQFMDATWREMQAEKVVPQDASPFDPHWAIVAQHEYMRRHEVWTRRQLPGVDPWIASLVCYNWGPGNWKKAVKRAQLAGMVSTLAWVKYCPKESQDYIKVIPARAEFYRSAP